MKKIVSLSFLFGTLFLLGSCFNESLNPNVTGTLDGTVTIGPLCPVEPCNLSPSEIKAAYAARQILIYEDADTSKLIGRINLPPDGHYSISLHEGNYLIDLKENGADRSQDVPAEIVIESNKTVTHDIDIDTGIR